jgi:hypothetical protein
MEMKAPVLRRIKGWKYGEEYRAVIISGEDSNCFRREKTNEKQP